MDKKRDPDKGGPGGGREEEEDDPRSKKLRSSASSSRDKHANPKVGDKVVRQGDRKKVTKVNEFFVWVNGEGMRREDLESMFESWNDWKNVEDDMESDLPYSFPIEGKVTNTIFDRPRPYYEEAQHHYNPYNINYVLHSAVIADDEPSAWVIIEEGRRINLNVLQANTLNQEGLTPIQVYEGNNPDMIHTLLTGEGLETINGTDVRRPIFSFVISGMYYSVKALLEYKELDLTIEEEGQTIFDLAEQAEEVGLKLVEQAEKMGRGRYRVFCQAFEHSFGKTYNLIKNYKKTFEERSKQMLRERDRTKKNKQRTDRALIRFVQGNDEILTQLEITKKCAICFEDLYIIIRGESGMERPNGPLVVNGIEGGDDCEQHHRFHSQCIADYMNTSGDQRCPLCRIWARWVPYEPSIQHLVSNDGKETWSYHLKNKFTLRF